MALLNSTTYGNGLTAVQTESTENSSTTLFFDQKTTNSLKYPLNLFSRSESVSPAFIKFNIHIDIIILNTLSIFFIPNKDEIKICWNITNSKIRSVIWVY